MFVINMSVSMICLLLITLLSDSGIILVLWVSISFFNNIGRVYWLSELIGETDKKNRATMLSLNSLIFSFGSFIGAFTTGIIAESYGIRYAWMISVVGYLLAVSIMIFTIKHYKVKKVELETSNNEVS